MVDLPLTPQGHAQADHLGRRIAAKGGVHTISTSPMQRARDTTAAIMRHNPGARLDDVTEGLDPWHQGALEGRPVDEIRPALEHYAAHPDEKIPGVGVSGVEGESVNDHAKRVGKQVRKMLHKLRPGERHLVVAHHSTIRALRGWVKGGGKSPEKIDPSEMASKHDTAPPAGEILRLVRKRDGKPGLESNPLDSPEPIKPGLNFVRHGQTPWNSGVSALRKGPPLS
jgi:broad specificity phosphatase PhoE